ncbi:unnamed protein product [Zymoseptoria tritici ST99CH_1A5]|uniref:Uncharacterized protein n=1 Tax=Zymoseptoria tritici ST99CH_1A5 TaxID=1276529 RepID=A0A1Y6M101_ZYMTR|nr:unnamed protein product [Zymoseptoria tritici ST99CH_3D1]SMY30327.1 unnamed protein product [Zymoseptoria tritici ST99CH_1A5]
MNTTSATFDNKGTAMSDNKKSTTSPSTTADETDTSSCASTRIQAGSTASSQSHAQAAYCSAAPSLAAKSLHLTVAPPPALLPSAATLPQLAIDQPPTLQHPPSAATPRPPGRALWPMQTCRHRLSAASQLHAFSQSENHRPFQRLHSREGLEIVWTKRIKGDKG